jgi:shikimate dehydrogenase
MRYAEVIGDPIAQSKSPIIHEYWLEQLNLAGDYRRTLVPSAALAHFLEDRRRDPDWLGCNVTIPHKEQASLLVDRMDPHSTAIGAVNCIVPDGSALVGYNTDIDGIDAALASTDVLGNRAVVIGAGGAARAIVSYLVGRGVAALSILVRNPDRAQALQTLVPRADLSVLPLDRADLAFRGAAVIVNASPLGMIGADPMPEAMLQALADHAGGTTIFDMVTTPAETEFLAVGEARGARIVDGLIMLVGQARRAFELFFDVPAPQPDQRLRDLLTTDRSNSE